MAPHEHVSDTLIQLADTLVADFDLLDYLDLLLMHASAVLGATAGGVMLAGARGELKLLASSDERARMMELYELQRREGPSMDAHRLGEAVIAEDLTSSSPWPEFAPRALEEGFHAAFAFPLRLRDECIGALNLFRDQPGAITLEERRLAQALAHMAAIGILQQRAVRQARQLAFELEGALSSRVVLEQAKGIIAESAGVEMGQAYQLLRWYARRGNRSLREVAGQIVTKELPVSALLQKDHQ